MAPIIEARNLVKQYRKVRALDGLDLTAEAGRVVALLGPNGAGKTTFVRMLATLTQPTSGTLRVGGIDAVAEPQRVRRLIGLAGQYAAVEPTMTGRENLEMVARLFGLSRRDARTATDRVLRDFDLEDAADRAVKTYSGGMRRRVDLGASMVGAPRLLLLDEPTTGLDPRSRNELWEAIRALVARGTDVLLTTQYLDEADHLATDIVIVDHGRVVATGTPAELKARVGGDVVELHMREERALAGAGRALTLLGTEPPQVDAATRRVSVRVERGSDSLRDALRAMFLLIFRYVFGGAIAGTGVSYVNFLVPGFVVTTVLFVGAGAAAGVAEDVEQGFIDRLRSLPISRVAAVAGRALADTTTLVWALAVTTAIGFAVGFRLDAHAGAALAAFALSVLFGFAFAWVFICIGLFAGNAQAAQGMSLLVFPLTFVSSAYVPVASMPSWMRGVANNQPITVMTNAARALTQGHTVTAHLGHSTGWFVGVSLIWTGALVLVFAPIAVWRYSRVNV